MALAAESPRPREPQREASAAKRLCILTQYYPPEMGAPQARLSELADRLVDRGWRVDVLTALPNYPTGKLFDGYAKLNPVVERIGGARAVRVPLYPSKTGFAKRIATYLSFAGSAAALGPRYCRRPDLLFVETPPIFIGFAALSLAHRWDCPYVLNVSDLWPESAIRMGLVKPGVATNLAERFERMLYRRAAGVTGQSDEIVEAVRRLAPKIPAALITNGVDPARFGKNRVDAAARELIGSEPGPVAIFAGLLGWAQGLDQVLDLAKSLPPELPGRFVLVGDGPDRERLIERIRAEGLSRVRVLPPQPRERVPALLASADIALITLGMSIPGAVPSKIYEAMASGLPVLLVADGEPARRVEQAGAGIAVPPGKPALLRDAFEHLVTDPALRDELGAGGRAAATTTYNRDRIASRLDTFLSERIGPWPAFV